MPRLDERLKTVARQIRWPIHADIGSDHGHLLKSLLSAGRIQRGIAIENKRQPFENSRATLDGFSAEVRFADGLEGLARGEANGISICGMGGRSMVRILKTLPDRVPDVVLLQPNRCPRLIRQWGMDAGFHLIDELTAAGHWEYVVLRFQRNAKTDDPAYDGIDREAAMLFGPHLIRSNDPRWRAQLESERSYIQDLDRLDTEMKRRLGAIERIL